MRPHGGAEHGRGQLLYLFQPVTDLPEHEVGVAAHPHQAVAAD